MTHQLIVLDGKTLNPGDNPWTELEAYGKVTVYDRSRVDDIVSRVQSASIAITNKVPFDVNTIDQLPNLKLIAVTATGYNVVDCQHASNRKIVVCNVPAYSTQSVAQHVFAMLLSYLHLPSQHHAAVLDGEWQRRQDFSFTLQPLAELAGKTMGIVGLGQIGRATAKVAEALGMEVLAHSRTQTDPLPYQGFRWLPLDELFAQSDVISFTVL
ncbi:MAG: NAD(P)-dependent oxidoreductase [Planctomycetota bacterium]